RAHPGPGPARGPPGGAGVSARLCSTVSHGWLSRVSDGLADPLWAVGAATAPAGARSSAQAALDATTPPALCAGGQDRAAPAPGWCHAPRGVRHLGCCRAGTGAVRLAHQYRLCRAPHPDHPSAGGGGGTGGLPVVQGRGRRTPAAGLVSRVLSFLLTARELTPPAAPG